MPTASSHRQVGPLIDLCAWTNADLAIIYSQLRQLRQDGVPKFEVCGKNVTRPLCRVWPCSIVVTRLSETALSTYMHELDIVAVKRAVEAEDENEAIALVLDNLFLQDQSGRQTQMSNELAGFDLVPLLEGFSIDLRLVDSVERYLVDCAALPADPIKGVDTTDLLTTVFYPPTLVMLALAALRVGINREHMTELEPTGYHTLIADKMMNDMNFLDDIDAKIQAYRDGFMEDTKEQENSRFSWQHILEACDDVDRVNDDLDRQLTEITASIDRYKTEQNRVVDEHQKNLQRETLTEDGSSGIERPLSAASKSTTGASFGHRLLPDAPAVLPTLSINSYCFYMRALDRHWDPAIICNISKFKNGDTLYQVKPSTVASQVQFSLSGREVAFAESPNWLLAVGQRVVAKYVSDTKQGHEGLYAGVVGEQPSHRNEGRYLIFFDDGYTQYAQTNQVYRVAEFTRDAVWRDVEPGMTRFIREYLKVQDYRDRAMVRLIPGKKVIVQLNNEWRNAMVLSVDASLARIAFHGIDRLEWIYRGSTRFRPLYLKQLMQSGQGLRNRKCHKSRMTEDSLVVEYVALDEGDNTEQEAVRNRPQVARKSTAASSKFSRHLSESGTISQSSDNEVVFIQKWPAEPASIETRTVEDNPNAALSLPHSSCNPACLRCKDDPSVFKFENPYYVPLAFGWSRYLAKVSGVVKKRVVYQAPCGRRLSAWKDISKYILDTGSLLYPDHFCFDSKVDPLKQFVVRTMDEDGKKLPHVQYIDDVTRGQENVKIPVVNCIDSNLPPMMEYQSYRFPGEDVNLNDTGDFIACCSCLDNCADKNTCECIQRTITYTGSEQERENGNARYVSRLLRNFVATGVYECNAQCPCSQQLCPNRVAQLPMKRRLQLFKTRKKGWGLRSVDDIPCGGFICIYAGEVLTDKGADEIGRQLGDEYFAELDLIEILEDRKDGFEEFVKDPDDVVLDQLRKLDEMNLSDCEAQSDQTSMKEMNDKGKSIRDYFCESGCYILDAKTKGNIGRYINHSCDPNVFVQNVFVDTHDLRFPWIAFFAGQFIPAGTELSWDYNYEVDSVPGRAIKCYCESELCRGRLL